MLKDAQRAVDDLSAISRRALPPIGASIGPIGGAGPDKIREENVARIVAWHLSLAHAQGLDVGAGMARLLAANGVADDVELKLVEARAA